PACVRSPTETFVAGHEYTGPRPTATWLGLAGVLVAAAFLILRHARGWGTPGAWMHRSADTTETDGGASAPTPPPRSEPSPGCADDPSGHHRRHQRGPHPRPRPGRRRGAATPGSRCRRPP